MHGGILVCIFIWTFAIYGFIKFLDEFFIDSVCKIIFIVKKVLSYKS